MNQELPDVQAGFGKGRGTRYQTANVPLNHRKRKRFPEITSTSALLTTLNPVTVWITANCGKFLKRWEYQTTLPASREICKQVTKQQLELDIEQQTGSRSGKENVKAVYCPSAYLISIKNTSCKMLGTSWNEDCQEKYQ